MILALDVGNTNTVIGCLTPGEPPDVFRISTDISRTADEYTALILSVLQFNGITRDGFTGAIISCVVPPLTAVVKTSVKLLTGIDAIIVGAGIKTGVNILIDDPGQLAADMVSTAVAAQSRYKPPVIICDLGTATKMTVINSKGNFIGGAILPGVALSMNALSAATSQLPKVPLEPPDRCISANTPDCMKSGAIFGAAAMIDGMCDRFEDELGESAVIIATGGLAEAVCTHCRRDIIIDPHLLLCGLEIIYAKNIKKQGS